jgi:hypothetical protein
VAILFLRLMLGTSFKSSFREVGVLLAVLPSGPLVALVPAQVKQDLWDISVQVRPKRGRLQQGSGAAAAILLKMRLDSATAASMRLRAAESVPDRAQSWKWEISTVD